MDLWECHGRPLRSRCSYGQNWCLGRCLRNLAMPSTCEKWALSTPTPDVTNTSHFTIHTENPVSWKNWETLDASFVHCAGHCTNLSNIRCLSFCLLGSSLSPMVEPAIDFSKKRATWMKLNHISSRARLNLHRRHGDISWKSLPGYRRFCSQFTHMALSWTI